MSYLAEVQYVDYMVDAFNHHVFEADTCSLYVLMINWGLEMPLDDAKLVSELQRTREIAAIVLDSTKKREDWADAANSARNLMGKIAYLGLTLAEVPVKMVAECLAVYLGTPKLYHAKKQYKPLQEAVARRIGELETGATELPLSGDDFWRNHHGVKDVAYIKDLEGGGEYVRGPRAKRVHRGGSEQARGLEGPRAKRVHRGGSELARGLEGPRAKRVHCGGSELARGLEGPRAKRVHRGRSDQARRLEGLGIGPARGSGLNVLGRPCARPPMCSAAHVLGRPCALPPMCSAAHVLGRPCARPHTARRSAAHYLLGRTRARSAR
jgi:hypothetical protein